MRGLFISYDGMTGLIGQSQSWPMLAGLAREGHEVDILSFEMLERAALRQKVASDCASAGIAWHPRRFRRAPPLVSKMIDFADMRLTGLGLARSRGYHLIHCRGCVPADAGLAIKRRTGLPLIFDTRGFWVDERRESGRWPGSNAAYRALYQVWKRRERALVGGADEIIVLTEAARREIECWPVYRGQRVSVIPCPVDLSRFPLRTVKRRAEARARLAIAPDAAVVVYLGSLGPAYAVEAMLASFRSVAEARPGARLLMIGHHDADVFAARAAIAGVTPGAVITVAAEHREIAGLLAAADLGLSFRRPGFSARGVSPIKLGEYLAVGLPVVCNAGVGDVTEIVTEADAGLVLPDLEPRSTSRVGAALDGLLARDPAAIRAAAARRFSLGTALERYHDVWCEAGAAGSAGPIARPSRLG